MNVKATLTDPVLTINKKNALYLSLSKISQFFMKKVILSIQHVGLLLVLSTVIQSCEKKPQDPDLDALFDEAPVTQLKSQPLNIEETEDMFFGKILEMVYANEMLIIRDIDKTHRMKIVDLEPNRMVKFGKIGEGPNEFIGEYTRPSVDYKNNMLYVSDYPHYYLYNLDSLKNGTHMDPIQKIRINLKEDNLIESTFSGGYVVGSLFKNRF